MVAAFKEKLKSVNPIYIKFDTLQTLQLNLGNVCNLRCSHCHLSCSPEGTGIMEQGVMDRAIGFLARQPGLVLDMTGGCPELNPLFRYLVERTEGLARRRMVRSNLTILSEPGMEWLPDFYRDHQLVIVASLPCYEKENVDRQRGSGVFERSIEALHRLNAVGYGETLELNLVYNPGGAFIAGSQKELASAYGRELYQRHGIRFNNLYTITNAPIGRFREYLEARGAYERYLNLLAGSFNREAAGNIMCRSLVSVDWNGFLYNCDFNLAVGLPITGKDGTILKIDDLQAAATSGTELFLAQHCYCCTAGEGSSCTGALVA
ncbi:arsenosugar biosynthesis radical SAM (seleno)protein ArsS [Geobacter sp. DSM 9736]|uniref:arsenosugar biosynthesis radical SAM (seleno)protein ArsS n=1 Tax=Geobacter sp. DSM 9736 TaxID=1277350 RepID=UPI000B51374B|nr:arsenosugar biosynthesis radical SAM (seleno)protein ArsS [Geobacter sp. DSM 9736]SNB44725.1 radical SAM/Cys-rich domain-containing protein [Geobacter sp. DSM 9736]